MGGPCSPTTRLQCSQIGKRVQTKNGNRENKKWDCQAAIGSMMIEDVGVKPGNPFGKSKWEVKNGQRGVNPS